jgi:hypothetical protein
MAPTQYCSQEGEREGQGKPLLDVAGGAGVRLAGGVQEGEEQREEQQGGGEEVPQSS